jgi:hypothetical protein
MKVSTNTDRRLVLTANRRLGALACLAMGPFCIWLGLKIVEEGDTEWFGWSFAVLGIFMVVLAVYAFLIRLSLTLDRDQDMIRFSLHGIKGRRNKIMAISDLERVVVRANRIGRMIYDSLDFVPRDGVNSSGIKINEFWTKTAANDAHFEVASWLKRTNEE